MITLESQGMSQPRIIVFVKAPRPGLVKTRLAATIGQEAACNAYRKLVETVLAGLAPLPHLELRYTPDDAESEILQWQHEGWSCAPQGVGDLGERMHRAIAETESPGIIIGSDCPGIKPADITAACEALNNYDLVLGPAVDGGYWLIGLATTCPAIFDGIQWSTNNVLNETLDRSEKAGLSVHLLRKLGDVDTANDWAAFVK